MSHVPFYDTKWYFIQESAYMQMSSALKSFDNFTVFSQHSPFSIHILRSMRDNHLFDRHHPEKLIPGQSKLFKVCKVIQQFLKKLLTKFGMWAIHIWPCLKKDSSRGSGDNTRICHLSRLLTLWIKKVMFYSFFWKKHKVFYLLNDSLDYCNIFFYSSWCSFDV